MIRRTLLSFIILLSACTVQRWQPSRAVAVDDHMAHMSAADLRAPAVMPQTGAAAQDAGPANVAATKDGWPRTMAFLKKQLNK